MNATVRLLESVVPSSVTVRADVPASHPSAQILGTERTGSGTIVDASGIVLTVNYLVLGAQSVNIVLVDATTVGAEVVAQDFYSGLAALKIPGSGYPTLRTQAGRTPAVGQEVFILASAGGAERRVNTGAVFSTGPFDAYWEYHLERSIVSTAMNPGYGGGALIDTGGYLVGVVSLDLSEVGRFTMAIPVDYFVEHRDELLVNGRRVTRPLRAWVGLYCYELRDHVVVAGVLPGAPGEQAGLRAGDVIVGVNGTKVRERRELYHCLWAHKPGDVLRLDVFRQNALTEVQLQAGDAEQFFA